MTSRRKTPPTTRRRSAPPTPETPTPLTLDEATVMALGARPKRRRAARPALPSRARGETPSAASVALERRQLRIAQRAESAQRIDDYCAVMGLLKVHGVRASAAAGKRRAPRGARKAPRAVTRPLQVFAEGDSWFDYPVPGFGGGIVPRLQKLLGVPVLDLAKAGDEVRYMLGVEQRREIIRQFTRGCPAGGPWDAMIFSGGGNDIVADPMALWIRDYDPTLAPGDHVHAQRFGAALAVVAAGYEDLITLRDRLSPATHLVFHTYDFAIPDGRGFCHLGPWLKPTLDLRGFPNDLALRSAVVRAMLRQFAAMLASLARPGSVTVIDGQGTLAPVKDSWHNELHPSKAGYDRFAAKFRDALKAQFPDRLP